LLKYARESGAKVFEQTRITEVKFEDDDFNKRPIAAVWKSETETGTISFDFVVDASGRAGVLSTKYLKNRKVNQSLKNTACWGYWKNCGRYGEGTPRRNAIWSESLTGQ
jgi:flavin-dependent dehydrogenase